MHPKFLHLLCCPDTREPLELEAEETSPAGLVVTGRLVSRSGRRYPIVRGIPRFVDDQHYSASFGYEWTRWPRVQFESENIGRPMEGETTRMWEAVTRQEGLGAAREKTIVEFGCGPGRFLDVVRRKGGAAVGIDLSQAVEVARTNFEDDPDVLIVQGDVTRAPFLTGSFDGGFSIGVLHHIPEPLQGLRELTRCVRPQGWVACAVYRKGSFYDLPSVARLRRLHSHISKHLGNTPALAYSFLAAYGLYYLHLALYKTRLAGLAEWLWRNVWVIAEFPDARWRLLDTFDAVTPHYASCHTAEEVQAWMSESGCRNIRQAPWSVTSFTGTKA